MSSDASTANDRPMAGKVCLVTGATSGIGEVAARALADKGATVVIVARNAEKCRRVVDSINGSSGDGHASAIVADLSLQGEVRRAADEFAGRHGRLDVLLNNAGAMFMERRVTGEGLERTFALNHLAPFALTNRLLALLERSRPSRVVTVSSEAHRAARGIDFDDLQGVRRYGGWSAYGASKLMNILFSNELARRLEGAGVTSNALHPGFVRSGFFGGSGPAWWTMRRLADLFAISPEKGAETPIYLAASPEVEGVTGRYFVKCREREPSAAAKDAAAAARLWETSESLAGAPSPA